MPYPESQKEREKERYIGIYVNKKHVPSETEMQRHPP